MDIKLFSKLTQKRTLHGLTVDADGRWMPKYGPIYTRNEREGISELKK